MNRNDATDAAYQRGRYYKRKAAGVCTRCPNLAVPGQVRCTECADEVKAARKASRYCPLCDIAGHGRKEHPSIGLCIHCPSPTTEKMCTACTARQQTHQRALANQRVNTGRAAALKRGRCGRCWKRKIAKGSRSRCQACLAYAAQHERGRTVRSTR